MLAAALLLVGCTKKTEATADAAAADAAAAPTADAAAADAGTAPAADAAAAPEEAGTPPADAVGVAAPQAATDPCGRHAARTAGCLIDELGGTAASPDTLASLHDAARRQCEGWGTTDPDRAAIMAACGELPCGEYDACIARKLLEHPTTTDVPPPDGPFPGGPDAACDALIARMIGCLADQMGPTALPPESMDEMRRSIREMCDSMAQVGVDVAAGVARCASRPCDDFLECLMDPSAMAGALVPPPPPPPVDPSGAGTTEVPPWCVPYLERSVACMVEQMGTAADPETLSTMRSAMAEACNAITQAGLPPDGFLKAHESCAAATCADYPVCFAEAFARAMMP
jgi:hypothetical protein